MQDDDKKVKNYMTETILDACHIVANGNFIDKEDIREKITEITETGKFLFFRFIQY